MVPMFFAGACTLYLYRIVLAVTLAEPAEYPEEQLLQVDAVRRVATRLEERLLLA